MLQTYCLKAVAGQQWHAFITNEVEDKRWNGYHHLCVLHLCSINRIYESTQEQLFSCVISILVTLIY